MRDGQEIATGIKTIDYPHIPTQTLFPRADVKLVRAEIRTLAKSIGYVMGAGDDMPEVGARQAYITLPDTTSCHWDGEDGPHLSSL